jgi:hypothetical protein
MAANPERGEAAIELDGVEYVLRPTYEAIQAVEDILGKGIVKLGREALDGALTSRETAVIATEFIKAWGRETENTGAAHANPDKIGRLLYAMKEGGTANALAIVAAVLTMAATGGFTPEGELKATPSPTAK